MAKKLATKAVATTNAMDLINKTPGFVKPLESTGGSAVYVQFAHPNAENYSGITAAASAQRKTVTKGQPCLVTADQIMVLDKFEFIILPHHFQYWADVDGEGKPVKVYDEPMRWPVKEFIEAGILVVYNGEITPATCRFMGPKCPGIKKAVDMLETVQTDEWQRQSKEHGLPAKSKAPCWAWFVNVGQMEHVKPKKIGGFPYETLSTTDRPTTALELKHMNDCMTDPTWVDKVSAVLNIIGIREKEIADLREKSRG